MRSLVQLVFVLFSLVGLVFPAMPPPGLEWRPCIIDQDKTCQCRTKTDGSREHRCGSKYTGTSNPSM
ncbi:hypothetical protein PGT21_016812 [Puccinia graminis f. sp. tritici]|uniref:Uncharacterized protein n=1 Tax=Puccinia graminis f. sp. tritici TaxID=56615 RepID=A0A5B0PFT5_PUCGR|nr:hypothetical protein PGTUg99_023229 [Puccinia graminis f. sp. tritici]KAA1099672.1 hypothetical protein PGT21_016812 [Puccinia graminis f. sp. tritici]